MHMHEEGGQIKQLTNVTDAIGGIDVVQQSLRCIFTTIVTDSRDVYGHAFPGYGEEENIPQSAAWSVSSGPACCDSINCKLGIFTFSRT